MNTLDEVTGLGEFMANDHRRCDGLCAEAKRLASAGRWDSAGAVLRALDQALAHHLAMEEHVLFPVLEGSRSAPMGPTQTMRVEHEDMRELLAEMSEALKSEDRDRYLGLSETLLMLRQRHNLEEEQVLYPLAEQILGDSAAEVLKAMQHVVVDAEDE
jgi:hemerythrin-like domain-containing protein